MVDLRRLPDDELAALAASVGGVGRGGSGIVDVDGTAVFCKRVPLTDRELARPRSTANLHGLPPHCNYGIGGPGINGWRELAANERVTAAVRAGRTSVFPVLHHWRVLPGRPPIAAEHADVAAVVASQGGHPAVGERLRALHAASHSLVLCFQPVPLAAADWLADDPAGKAVGVERDLVEMVTVLGELRLLHLDGHFGNLRSDGDRLFLTDFGLAVSPDFELAPDEAAFVARNVTHDAGYASMRLVNWLVTAVAGVPVRPGEPPVERNAHVRALAAGRAPTGVPPHVAEILVRHAPAAARLNDFLWRLFDGEVDTPYPLP